jgi:hypothetical protein
MWSKIDVTWTAKDGWAELTIPSVRIYEVVRVDLK